MKRSWFEVRYTIYIYEYGTKHEVRTFEYIQEAIKEKEKLDRFVLIQQKANHLHDNGGAQVKEWADYVRTDEYKEYRDDNIGGFLESVQGIYRITEEFVQ